MHHLPENARESARRVPFRLRLLRYSTFVPDEIRKQFRGDVIYCPEEDVHFPTLTVQETLDFAAKTRTPEKRCPSERCDATVVRG